MYYLQDVKYACFTYLTYFAYLQSGLITLDPTLVYERKENQQVLYAVPIISILGRLAPVPAGETGTIPYSMRSGSALYPAATCDSRHGACQHLGNDMVPETMSWKQ